MTLWQPTISADDAVSIGKPVPIPDSDDFVRRI
jgi:hypothetical protein